MLNVCSVLVTGSNRGLGLEMVRQLAGKSNRPERIFATCRDPEGPRAQVRTVVVLQVSWDSMCKKKILLDADDILPSVLEFQVL